LNAFALQARGLTKLYGGGRTLFGRRRPLNHAVDNVALSLSCGETLGIVGESGCGKSTLARMLSGLTLPSAGTVAFNGRVFVGEGNAPPGGERRVIQYVFQDPLGSLNPRKTVRSILEAPLKRLARLDRNRRGERLLELMDAVKLGPEFFGRFPHELSGGQAQRIGVARALAADPTIIVLDEPVSALDVSVQAQVLGLLGELQRRFGLAYVFISHNLAATEAVSDRIAVMYFGRIVEEAPARQLFANPRHPYTRLLLDSAPVIDASRNEWGSRSRNFPILTIRRSAAPLRPAVPTSRNVAAARRQISRG
jgi:ABC-type glutathione transport system ATPase component